MQTTFVTTLYGYKIGTYWDLGSSDNYITNKMAKKLGLKGSEREIEAEGIRRQKHIKVTMLYNLLIVDNNGCQHEVQCYGLDRITSAGDRPDRKGYTELCRKFGVGVNEVKKPSEIQLLLLMRSNYLHPSSVKRIDKMKLDQGPFGKVLWWFQQAS